MQQHVSTHIYSGVWSSGFYPSNFVSGTVILRLPDFTVPCLKPYNTTCTIKYTGVYRRDEVMTTPLDIEWVVDTRIVTFTHKIPHLKLKLHPIAVSEHAPLQGAYHMIQPHDFGHFKLFKGLHQNAKCETM